MGKMTDVESQRLAALRRYGILDTPPEHSFDRITHMVARLFEVPIALISLVAEDRQWFKSCYGLGFRETNLLSFCVHAIQSDEVMVVPDAWQDHRFRHNPLVTDEPGIRFYAGAPLKTPDGFNLGSLCILDTAPHQHLSAEQEVLLADLAALSVSQFELRLTARNLHEEAAAREKEAAERERTLSLLRATFDSISDSVLSIDLKGKINSYNQAFVEMWRVPEEVIASGDDSALVKNAQAQLNNPEHFLERVRELYDHLEATSYDVLELKDGRIIERTSLPERLAGKVIGRIWTFRDITERERALADLKARESQQASVAALGQFALRPNGLEQVFEEAVEALAVTLQVEFTKVLELSPDGGTLTLCAGVGWHEGLVGSATVSTDRSSQAGYTLHSARPVVVEDLRHDTRFNGPPLLHNHGVISGMSVIIHGQERPFGVLGVHTSKKRQFNQDDINYLQTVANILSMASERKRAGTALVESEEKFRQLAEHINEVFWLTDPQKSLMNYVSPAYEVLWGRTRESLYKRPTSFLEAIHADDQERVLAALEKQARGEYEEEYRVVRPDGSVRWVRDRAFPIRNEAGDVHRIAGIAEDITRHKELEEALRETNAMLKAANDVLERRVAERTAELERTNRQLAYDAFHDSLTGLTNRALVIDRLGQAIEKEKRNRKHAFAVLFLDLDRLKVVNDSLGHAVGDALLIAVARRLEAFMRPTDTLARLGGDEFVILLEGISSIEDAVQLAERLQSKLQQPFELGGHKLHTSASIGIAFSEVGYDRAQDVLLDADVAMYYAKAQGKASHQVFRMEMRDRAVAVLPLETSLRTALEHQELQLYYQPIASLQSGAIVGFEALLRWHHPQHGVIALAELIPLAEETGLIIDINRWVMGEACRQLRAWRGQYPTVTVSINIAAQQVTRTYLFTEVKAILREMDLEPSAVQLEITETALMNSAEFLQAFKDLRALGVWLAIDDFGTGYSSLSYLQSFPIHTLKIDRSFVSGMIESHESAELVRIIITLAQSLGMAVVAEGVETSEQLTRLKALGCDYAQGYFFSRPLPAKAATRLLEQKVEYGHTLTP